MKLIQSLAPLLVLTLLAGCGTTTGARTASGAAIGAVTGAGLGALGGYALTGLAAGTAVGAGAGYLYDQDQRQAQPFQPQDDYELSP